MDLVVVLEVHTLGLRNLLNTTCVKLNPLVKLLLLETAEQAETVILIGFLLEEQTCHHLPRIVIDFLVVTLMEPIPIFPGWMVMWKTSTSMMWISNPEILTIGLVQNKPSPNGV